MSNKTNQMKIQEWDEDAGAWIDMPSPTRACNDNISFGEAAAQMAGSVAARFLPEDLKQPFCGIYEEYMDQRQTADIIR